MMRVACMMMIVLMSFVTSTRAQNGEPAADPVAETPREFESMSARRAVREANTRLLDGDVDAALQAYDHAKELRPDAPQIPFGQGLAELKRKEYAAARDLFRETAAGGDPALAADAQYALGASHHLEALESENPEEAIEHLEAAMERYRDVLSRKSDHVLARESDYKAASMRRRLKQLLQQQQQQQQQQNEGGEQEEQDDQEQQQSESQEQQEGEQQDENQPSQSQPQEGDQDQEQQQSQNGEQEQDEEQEQSQQQQSQDEQEQDESEEQKQAQAREQEEEVSREQAERRLREMMQAIRDRQKQRRQETKKIPLPPVGKDW